MSMRLTRKMALTLVGAIAVVVATGLLLAAVPQSPRGDGLTPVKKIGTFDRGFGHLEYAAGVFAGNGKVYVADTGNHRILELNEEGRPTRQWGGMPGTQTKDTAEAEMYFQKDMEAAKSGDLYVADTMNHRIVQFGPDGRFIRAFGGLGNGPGKLMCPYGVTVTENAVIVADTMAHRIVVFDRDGNYIRRWGTFGTRPGQFQFPHDVAVDSRGAIYATDMVNHRIQKFSPEGRLLRTWGGFGSQDGKFNYPWGISVDNEDGIWVADMGNYRVQKFSTAGEHLLSYGRPGTGPGEFTRPKGISVDDDGNLWVADSGVQKIAHLRIN